MVLDQVVEDDRARSGPAATADGMWNTWTTRGRVALIDGDVDRAAVAFERAARAAEHVGNGPLRDQLDAVVRLIGHLRLLRRRRHQHQAAQAVLAMAERRTVAQLLEQIAPGEYDLAKALTLDDEPKPYPDLWSSQTPTLAARNAAEVAVADQSSSDAGERELVIELLGPVQVAVNGIVVDGWSSGRARSLLAYLSTHRTPWPPCEVLMEVFWPGSPAAAARNSLHVAIHALRRVLRTATSAPVIVLKGDTYRIEPTLRLRLDIEEFDERHRRAHRHLHLGEHELATAEYESAIATYRGDFLAENPYEDWAAATRERLRLTYLDAVGQLSMCYFDTDRYAASAMLCRQLLDSDPCHEDAWRRLMRCNARQGQIHRALQDFQDCAQAMRDQLGIDPDLATVTLRNQISRREPV